ncbi:hypothetical protein RRG08_002867 [Elysia crispata]|uniref:Uncharacterized protein n=1 Tax=Elysia crispata TaxID=231223 RepID=A0AAE1CMS5_9GAST|nr:hypothetical protein RRG08_002867 [Elysia crispata]
MGCNCYWMTRGLPQVTPSNKVVNFWNAMSKVTRTIGNDYTAAISELNLATGCHSIYNAVNINNIQAHLELGVIDRNKIKYWLYGSDVSLFIKYSQWYLNDRFTASLLPRTQQDPPVESRDSANSQAASQYQTRITGLCKQPGSVSVSDSNPRTGLRRRPYLNTTHSCRIRQAAISQHHTLLQDYAGGHISTPHTPAGLRRRPYLNTTHPYRITQAAISQHHTPLQDYTGGHISTPHTPAGLRRWPYLITNQARRSVLRLWHGELSMDLDQYLLSRLVSPLQDGLIVFMCLSRRDMVVQPGEIPLVWCPAGSSGSRWSSFSQTNLGQHRRVPVPWVTTADVLALHPHPLKQHPPKKKTKQGYKATISYSRPDVEPNLRSQMRCDAGSGQGMNWCNLANEAGEAPSWPCLARVCVCVDTSSPGVRARAERVSPGRYKLCPRRSR